jgi:hypothetical protein
MLGRIIDWQLCHRALVIFKKEKWLIKRTDLKVLGSSLGDTTLSIMTLTITTNEA